MIALLLLPLLGGCARAPEGSFHPDTALAPALARLDTDHDGRVEAAEYARVDFSGPTFEEADVDADGALSLDELRTLTFTQDPMSFYVAPGEGPKKPRRGRGGAGGRGPGGGTGREGPGTPGESRPGDKLEEEGEIGRPDGPREGAGERAAEVGPGLGRGARSGLGRKNSGVTIEAMRPPASLLVFEILRAEIVSADATVPVPSVDEIERVGRAGSLVTEEARALLARLEDASASAHVDFPAALRATAPSLPDGAAATTAADP